MRVNDPKSSESQSDNSKTRRLYQLGKLRYLNLLIPQSESSQPLENRMSMIYEKTITFLQVVHISVQYNIKLTITKLFFSIQRIDWYRHPFMIIHSFIAPHSAGKSISIDCTHIIKVALGRRIVRTMVIVRKL